MAKSKPAVKKEVIEEVEVVKVACPDCTVLVADGGRGEFRYPKAGLINEKTLCSLCKGSGLVENNVQPEPKTPEEVAKEEGPNFEPTPEEVAANPEILEEKEEVVEPEVKPKKIKKVEEVKVEKLAEPTYAELVAKAKELGLKEGEGTKKEDLIKAIAAAEPKE